MAIKSIPSTKYDRLSFENKISEANAMNLCRKSPHVVTLVDHFEIEGETFIVSKYAPGGDLASYLNKRIKKNRTFSEGLAQSIML